MGISGMGYKFKVKTIGLMSQLTNEKQEDTLRASFDDVKMKTQLSEKNVIYAFGSDIAAKNYTVNDTVAMGDNQLFEIEGDTESLLYTANRIELIRYIMENNFPIAYTNIMPDMDGTVRKIPLLLKRNNKIFLTMSLYLFLKYHELTPEDIRIEDNEIKIEKLNYSIPVTDKGELYVNFFSRFESDLNDKSDKPVPVLSFLDIVQSAQDQYYDNIKPSIDPEKLKDRIVFIMPAIQGVAQLVTTSVSARGLHNIYSGYIHAFALLTLLNNEY